jgi:hypothetical protein
MRTTQALVFPPRQERAGPFLMGIPFVSMAILLLSWFVLLRGALPHTCLIVSLVWSARKYSQCLLRLVGSGCRVWSWPSKAALIGAAIGVLIGIRGVLALGRPPGRMLAALILAGSRMIRLLFVSGLSDEMLGYVLPTVRASMVKSGLGWHLSTWTSKGT